MGKEAELLACMLVVVVAALLDVLLLPTPPPPPPPGRLATVKAGFSVSWGREEEKRNDKLIHWFTATHKNDVQMKADL